MQFQTICMHTVKSHMHTLSWSQVPFLLCDRYLKKTLEEGRVFFLTHSPCGEEITLAALYVASIVRSSLLEQIPLWK